MLERAFINVTDLDTPCDSVTSVDKRGKRPLLFEINCRGQVNRMNKGSCFIGKGTKWSLQAVKLAARPAPSVVVGATPCPCTGSSRPRPLGPHIPVEQFHPFPGLLLQAREFMPAHRYPFKKS